MQPIERYGLIALVFLVITIAAACLWDPKDPKDKQATGQPDGTAVAQDGDGAPAGAPRPRDFIGARTPAPGQSLSERQRERLLALQQEEASAAGEPRGDEISAREAALARREAALAAREAGETPEDGQEPAFKTHLAERAGELFDAASGKARDVADLVRPDPQSTPAAPPATKRTYEIKQGDTLSEIASNELGTWKRWQEIIDANPGLDAQHMRVGARIALPGGPADAGAPRGSGKTAATRSAAGEQAGPTYVVQSDDSLWDIAEQTLGDGERWREIAAANPKVNPDKLLVGQRLVLPSGAVAGPAAASSQRVAQADAPKRGKVR